MKKKWVIISGLIEIVFAIGVLVAIWDNENKIIVSLLIMIYSLVRIVMIGQTLQALDLRSYMARVALNTLIQLDGNLEEGNFITEAKAQELDEVVKEKSSEYAAALVMMAILTTIAMIGFVISLFSI